MRLKILHLFVLALTIYAAHTELRAFLAEASGEKILIVETSEFQRLTESESTTERKQWQAAGITRRARQEGRTL